MPFTVNGSVNGRIAQFGLLSNSLSIVKCMRFTSDALLTFALSVVNAIYLSILQQPLTTTVNDNGYSAFKKMTIINSLQSNKGL